METNQEWKNIVINTMVEVKNRYPQLCHAVEFGIFWAPEDHFVSYIFRTDQDLKQAEGSGLTDEINETHRRVLSDSGYPPEGIKNCEFASQESCDRDFEGNWYYYYK